jgi:DNA-binding PadR family transcriptional regulator
MSLRYALLGFLNYGPMTGYELKKSFDVSIAHFWNAELSQIYPTLKQLEAEGLVAMKVQVQTERPNRKVYSLTDDGRSELCDWLATPEPADSVREPLLIKLFLGAAVSRGALVGVLRSRIDELTATLEAHRAVPSHVQQFAAAIGLRRDAAYWQLATDAYLSRLEAEAAWLDKTAGKLEHLDAEALADRPRRGRKKADVRESLQVLAELVPGHRAIKGGKRNARGAKRS